ncbi:MAG: hypothetical protein Q8M29_16015 [Bacteroidota bacterium]|nr:hypothetical protein [Bacteroidota bacterium]
MKDTIKHTVEIVTCCQPKTDTLAKLITTPQKELSNSHGEIFGLTATDAKFAIPIIVTISIFILTQLISWIKSKSEKRKEILSYRNIITQWVTLIESSITQQINACRDFSTRLTNSTDIHPETFQYNKLQVEKVESISVDRYISAFVTNSTGAEEPNYRMTFSLISQFNFLKNIENEIPNIYSVYQKQTFEIMDEWNVNFRSLDSLISKQTVTVRTTTNHPTAIFHTQVLQTANAWLNGAPNGRSSVSYSMTNLIEPLSTFVKVELNTNPNNDYAFNLSACLQELRISHLKWQTNLSGNILVFTGIADKLNDVYTGLTNSRNHFIDNTRVRYFWAIK